MYVGYTIVNSNDTVVGFEVVPDLANDMIVRYDRVSNGFVKTRLVGNALMGRADMLRTLQQCGNPYVEGIGGGDVRLVKRGNKIKSIKGFKVISLKDCPRSVQVYLDYNEKLYNS